MNKLIWVSEKELNYENNFISKIKNIKKISGYWSNFKDIKPITFEGENIVINWSYEFNKVEFYMSSEYFKDFLVYYYYLMYYGEWGDIQEKPIVFMEIYSNNFYIKSIKPFKTKDLYKFFESKNDIKIVIYFENMIDGNKDNENIELSDLGGLYHIANINWELNNKNYIKYDKKKIFNYEIENYIDWENFKNIYKENKIDFKKLKINYKN